MKLWKSINKFNDRLALAITDIVGTMWCAYVFTGLALISFPAAVHSGISALIQWIAQTFLQLTLLSVIQLGQNLESKKNARREMQDHHAIKDTQRMIKEIHEKLSDK